MQGKIPKGIYVSYDEKKHGPIEEAVSISNELGYLIWLDKSPLDPETRSLLFPAVIVVRTKEDRYFRGKLIAIHRRKEVDSKRLLSDTIHRPARWQQPDRLREYANYQSVLYIEELKPVSCPREIREMAPPQHPSYF
jgi:hypothetical protein